MLYLDFIVNWWGAKNMNNNNYKPTILTCETSEKTQKLLDKYLSEITTAEQLINANSQEGALEILKTKHVDLVISDDNPLTQGAATLLKEIRDSHPKTTFVFMTSKKTRALKLETYLKLGTKLIIHKPFTKRYFLKSIKKALITVETKRWLQEYNESNLFSQTADFVGTSV
jgi:DNA-binding NtrC family response regulator